VVTFTVSSTTANIVFNENSTAAVTTVIGVDPEGSAVTYGISGGADAALFAIDPTTGVLRFLTSPDYEAPQDQGANNVYNVTVTASDGTLLDTQALAISVANVAGISASLKSAGTLTGTPEADTLAGSSGNDTIYGLGGSDSLSGGAGNDTLIAGDGNDTLYGGAVRDLMTGGAGADVFRFTSIAESTPGAGHDIITDFGLGLDKLDLSGIDANTTHGGNQSFTFIGQTSTFTQPAQLAYHYEFIGGLEYTIVQGNVNANPAPDFEVALLGHVALTSSMLLL